MAQTTPTGLAYLRCCSSLRPGDEAHVGTLDVVQSPTLRLCLMILPDVAVAGFFHSHLVEFGDVFVCRLPADGEAYLVDLQFLCSR